MTTFDIYLLNIASDLKGAFMIISVLSGFSFIISVVIWASENFDEEVKNKIITKTLYIFLFSTTLSVFIPSTKQLASMIVLPKIMNNEQIQNTVVNGLDLMELTTKWLKENLKETSDGKTR